MAVTIAGISTVSSATSPVGTVPMIEISGIQTTASATAPRGAPSLAAEYGKETGSSATSPIGTPAANTGIKTTGISASASASASIGTVTVHYCKTITGISAKAAATASIGSEWDNTNEETDFMSYTRFIRTPGSSGHFTEEVYPREIKNNGADKIWFDVSGTGTMKVSLQRKPPATGATWETYKEFETNDRVELSVGASNVTWRAGVLSDADYTSGIKFFGFDW